MALPKHSYLLADAAPAGEIKRLQDIDTFMGPTTRARIDRLGLHTGWRCLEVGAGVGGVARWMAERVGPRGAVTAIDLKPLLANDPSLPQLEVLQHDILQPGLEDESYDLVHCRLLLVNVGNAGLALERMTRALRPGGWLIVEEPGDNRVPGVGESDSRVAEYNRLTEEFLRTLQERTRAVDLDLHRRLPAMFEAAGLVRIGGEVTHLLVGRDGRGPMLGTLDAVRPVLEGSAFASEGRLARLVALASDPALVTMGGATLALWGQRPA